MWLNYKKVEKITDLSYVSEIAAGDEAFIKELIETFLLQVPEFSGNMKNYLQNKQYDLLAREAHTAKSSVMLFGLNQLAAMLKEFQLLAGKQEKVETYPGLISEFDEICGMAAEELKPLI